MERLTFALSPFWADLHAAIVSPVLADLKTSAADASRDDHEIKKGQWKGAALLWSRIEEQRELWAREERSHRA